MRLCPAGESSWKGSWRVPTVDLFRMSPGHGREAGLSLLEKGFSLSSEGRLGENSWFV